MPGKHGEDAEDGVAQLCRRCRENTAVLVVRTDPLCKECFLKYVHTKTIKRLETFRVRNVPSDQQRKLLLPISFGVSSVSLLHILDHHLKTQQTKTRRTGFVIIVLFVDTSTVDGNVPRDHLLHRIQERYPTHAYHSAALEHLFSVASPDITLSNLLPNAAASADLSPAGKLTALMDSLGSATARADVIATLRTRLVVARAKALDCEGIVWGDSTTKLAEKTLAETAKGRGFALPWHVTDGDSAFDVTFNYPLRDVLKKELVTYSTLVEPPLTPLIHNPTSGATQPNMSSKNTTIDDLMKQYFESVEENFPSIVSNVVRTTAKLQIAPEAASRPRCTLCNMPVEEGRFGIHGWGGDQEDGLETLSSGSSTQFCYGCTRSLPSINVAGQ
ncbi:hypothetical protein P154DRAFT_535090 [Amniculicola lignicola CBS 123094]|uniref:Cytoplasmic tRNA 2-thiolation protein 2 n=1 Tax=Amniculicola lignicola CBS 123094 TaxID=1392246 RepID=A0A6A5WD72_9PLEO|nr:hypothetical protein P154DRAFT_535090 [Amniculicola lignicola CBS 123094]